MREYSIIIQPTNGGRDHWVASPSAAAADKFGKWVHKATGAAVQVYDRNRDQPRLTLGDFDEART